MCSRLGAEKKWRAEKGCHSWVHYRLTRSLSHYSTLRRGRIPRFEKMNRVDLGCLSDIRRRHRANCSRRCSIHCSIRCSRLSVEYHLRTTVVPPHHDSNKKKVFFFFFFLNNGVYAGRRGLIASVLPFQFSLIRVFKLNLSTCTHRPPLPHSTHSPFVPPRPS